MMTKNILDRDFFVYSPFSFTAFYVLRMLCIQARIVAVNSIKHVNSPRVHLGEAGLCRSVIPFIKRYWSLFCNISFMVIQKCPFSLSCSVTFNFFLL